MTDISILIPFLNEEDNIPRLGETLLQFTSAHPSISFELVLVNDGSKDRSLEVLQNTSFPSGTKVISLSQNYGSHAALRAGILNASGELITFLYADMQDPVELVLRLQEQIKAGADIAWASRNSTESGWSEKMFSKQYARLMRDHVNPNYPENGFDVVMFNQKVRAQLNANIENNSSIFLQILCFGFKQTFISYDKVARKAGKSKWTLSKKVKLFIDSFIAFSYAPIRFVTTVGIFFFVIGFTWTVYVLVRKFFVNDLAAGWPMLTSILLLGFGITNISLGILAEYLWRTLDSSRKRPVFIVDNIIELTRK